MRRSDREVNDKPTIYNIIAKCQCCRLGLNDNGEVYIVPLNFGYDILDDEIVLYFHGALEGRKIDIINRNPSVGFEMDTDYELIESEQACGFSSRWKSIIGTGKAEILNSVEDKIHAFDRIMAHYSNKTWSFNEKMTNHVCLFRVVVSQYSCKVHD